MISLKDRLTKNVLLISLLFYVIVIGFNVYFFNSFGTDFVRTRLEHDTETIINALVKDPTTGLYQIQHNEINPIFHQKFSGHYYKVFTQKQTFLSESVADFQMQINPIRDHNILLSLIEGPEGQSLLLLNGTYIRGSDLLQIAVSENYSPVFENLKWLGGLITIFSLVIIVLLSFMQRWVVTRGLAPLANTQDELAKLNKGDVKLLTENVPIEITPLVIEINQLLILADNRIIRSSNAIGNLAHSLKTPLALLEHILTSGNAPIEADNKTEMLEALDNIQHQIDSQLRKARIIGPLTRGQKILVTDTLAPLVSMLKKVYVDKNLTFDVHIDPQAEFYGDSHDLMELMGNLLDNACKWSKSQINVSIQQHSGHLNIEIHDDGPGANTTLFSALERRGARLDESEDGHGIGLSVVKEITDLYGATIRLDKSPVLGGLMLKISFPQINGE